MLNMKGKLSVISWRVLFWDVGWVNTQSAEQSRDDFKDVLGEEDKIKFWVEAFLKCLLYKQT